MHAGLCFSPYGDAKGTAYEQPASRQDFFPLRQSNESLPSLMHGAQVASRIGECGQRWLYASETTMSIPERPIGYAIPPTTSRQSHPRRVPTDLLSTRNHLLAPSIVPGKKSAANTEQIITSVYLSLIKRPAASLPASAIECQPLSTTTHYRWNYIVHAGNMYLYNTTHARTYRDAVLLCRNNASVAYERLH
ncbi:hypothetical protein GGI43DRAFT_147649 [Trichoderma evansii]